MSMKLQRSDVIMIIAGAAIGFGVVSLVMRQSAPSEALVVQSRAASPERGQSSYGTDMTILADRAGHYWLEAEVDRTTVRFMIDTGATSTVLSYDDADAVGVDVRRLTYDARVMTGAGEVKFARTMLPYVRSGNIRVDGLKALVAPEGTMAQSVLGMNFMRRLSSYSVASGKMTLVP